MNKLPSVDTFPPSNEREYRHQFDELVKSGPLHGFVVKNGTLVKASVMDTMLMKAKKMMELEDEEGRTPLHEAVIRGRKDQIELMALHEPEVFKSGLLKIDDRGHTPAHQEKIDISQLLLKHAPDEFNEVLLLQDDKGNNPLHLMADQEVKELATYVKTLRELSNYPTAMKMVNDNGYNFLSLIRLNRQ